MELSSRDLAEFALLGLQSKVLIPASITAWADGLIADGDIPEPWLIDLALARKPEELERALRSVPGEDHFEFPLRLFLALVLRRWRSGGLTTDDVLCVGWNLPYDLDDARTSDLADCRWRIVSKYVAFEDGECTADEFRVFIDGWLARFADLEPKLPPWV